MKKILYFLVTVVNGWNANILIKNNFQEKINIIEKKLGNKTNICFKELFYYLIDNKNNYFIINPDCTYIYTN